MNKTLIFKSSIAALGFSALGAAFSMAGCGGDSEVRGGEDNATLAQDFTVSTPAADGGTVTTQNAVVKWKFLPNPANPTQFTYALWIGDNYHPVTGCASDDEVKKVVGPTVQPINVATDETRAESDDSDPPQVIKQKGYRLSCLVADDQGHPGDYGDFSGDQTIYVQQTDTGSTIAYFPSGVTDGQYYSFNVDDACLTPLRDTLFKITDRRNMGWDVPGPPPDLTNEVKLQCASQVTGNVSYSVYMDFDPAMILPGQTEADCAADPDQCSFNSAVFVVESTEGSGRSAYLPIYRINGKSLFTKDANGSPTYSPELIALAKRFGVTITADMLPPDPIPDFWSKVAATKAGVRFWDVCVPEANAGAGDADAGDAGDAGAASCAYHHFTYPGVAGGTPVPNAPSAYKETLELEGTVYQELLGNPKLTSYDPFYPTFSECRGSMETLLGTQLTSTPTDSRAWVDTQLPIIQRNSPSARDPRFHCPALPGAASCTLNLPITSPADTTDSLWKTWKTWHPGVQIKASTLVDTIAAASCPTDTLKISVNANLDVKLAQGGIVFGRFRDVSLVGGGDTRTITFHEPCDPFTNPCTTGASRAVITLPSIYPTRNVTFDHMNLQYVADNAAATDAGPGFNLKVLMLTTGESSASDTHLQPRDRLVFSDSTIAADSVSRTTVTSSLVGVQTDVFAVRSTLGGMDDATSFWKTVELHDSLLVAAGTERGVARTPTKLLGNSGGLRYMDGKNDILAVNAVIQGPILVNGVSRGTFYDTNLKRSAGKEAIHFSSHDSANTPGSLVQMDWLRNSTVTNFQGSNRLVPFVIYEPLPVTPSVSIRGTVTFWDDPSGQLQSPVPVSKDKATEFGGASWCQGTGKLSYLSSLLPNQNLCLLNH